MYLDTLRGYSSGDIELSLTTQESWQQKQVKIPRVSMKSIYASRRPSMKTTNINYIDIWYLDQSAVGVLEMILDEQIIIRPTA